jgi:HAD superfamily hydrolase (TIGR01490 family)
VKLAVFDLDGTITRRDTLLPYLAGYLARVPWRLPRLLLALPSLLLFLVGVTGHGGLKSAFIRVVLGGCTRSQLDAWTAVFVPRVLTEGVFADALNRIASHKRLGDRLILMSASTDLYVPAIAGALGFDEVICTGLRWDGDRLDGHLSTPNRRGKEKARCFTSLRNEHPGHSTAAYGNAGSDLDHLRLADAPLLVNASWRARRQAARLGIPCAKWS